MMIKAHSKFINWLIPPQGKETHFKIIIKIYPVAEFLSKRFKFEVSPCEFCHNSDETLEHVFFSCNVSQSFWTEIKNWLSLKMNEVPAFNISHVLFFVDNLSLSIAISHPLGQIQYFL